MKSTRKIIITAAVISIIISMSSCSLFTKFNKKITVGNMEISIRDDMAESPSPAAGDGKIFATYSCGDYGMNIYIINATSAILSGKTSDDKLNEMLEGKSNPTAIQKSGEVSYLEYSAPQEGENYRLTSFLLDGGNEFYILEFYSKPEDSEKNMKQYQSIISTAKVIKETKAVTDVTIGGVDMTIDGDSTFTGSRFYSCERYLTSVSVYTVPKNYSSQAFCLSAAEQGGYKTVDGKDITEVQTTDSGISYFECYINNLYSYHYAKTDNKSLIYIFFFTKEPAGDQLREDFMNIANFAKLTSADTGSNETSSQ